MHYCMHSVAHPMHLYAYKIAGNGRHGSRGANLILGRTNFQGVERVRHNWQLAREGGGPPT